MADERALLRTLIDNLPDLIYVKDADSRFLLVNEAAASHLGAPTPDHAIGRTDFDFFPDEYAMKYRADEEKLLESGRPLINHEELTPTSSGDMHWLSTTKVPTRNESGLITGLVGMSRDITRRKELDAERAQLAEEQAALRRVATLVAHDVQASEIFAGVSEEVGRLFKSAAGVLRFEHGSGIVWVGVANVEIPIGTRWEFEEGMTAAEVYRTGRPARVEDMDWSGVEGPVGEAGRRLGVVSTVASPIVVEDRLWGAMIVSRLTQDRLPPDTEARLEKFTELVGTAIANAQSQEALAKLVEEQAALRRVATLVAQGIAAPELFAAAANEIANVVKAEAVVLARYERDRAMTILASVNVPIFDPGSRWELDGPSVVATVLDTGSPVRIDDYTALPGGIAAAVRASGISSVSGVPIIVEGTVWGAAVIGEAHNVPITVSAEDRVREFTELVATWITNAESRDQLRKLAKEQTALRRVATVAALELAPVETLVAVAEEAARALGIDAIGMIRFDDDEGATLVAQSHTPWDPPPLGTRFTLDGENVVTQVRRTLRTVRMDDWANATGSVAGLADVLGVTSAVATPIIVEGRLWGTLIAATDRPEPLPVDLESRIGDFCELIATAIGNAESREARTQLACEQAALRRVATLVAEGREPEALFSVVAEEVANVLDVAVSTVVRYEKDDVATQVGSWGNQNPFSVGTSWKLDEASVSGLVATTKLPARVVDYAKVSGEISTTLTHDAGIHAAVGAPILVSGDLWGVMMALSTEEKPLPADTETRLAAFTELIATAISNAATRSELVASRARIVAAADEARQRIERNLHDGTQQRLIALGLDIQRARAMISEDPHDARLGLERAETDLQSVLEDLRELSRGLHPPLLAHRGLGVALRALARDSPIPVELKIDLPERPPGPLETALYYIVSESLTNAVKHSRASTIDVEIEADYASERFERRHATDRRGLLRAKIVDDGVGGADPSLGSGLTGLADRIDALGGQFVLDSPSGGGTRISIELPLESH